MGMVEIVSDVLEQWGQELTDDLKANLANHDAYGRGELSKSIYPQVTTEANTEGTMDVRFILTMNDYWLYVNEGRRPNRGRMPPWGRGSKLWDWIKSSHKGAGMLASFMSENKLKNSIKATTSLSFLKSRAIQAKGTRATHFFDEVYTEGRLLQLQMMLTEKVGESLAQDIINNMEIG